MLSNRNYTIDVLRCIGTISVIFAHVNLPDILFQLRAFDVVLLVFISGMTFSINNKRNYFDYVKRRFHKLLIPTYAFLTILFIASYVVCAISNRDQLFPFKVIFYSYCFLDKGIGYIWIVKVYLIIAFILPLLKKIETYVRNEFLFVIVFCLTISFHSIIKHLIVEHSLLYDEFISYIIPYGLVSLLGMKWTLIDSNFKIFYFFLFLTSLFVGIGLDGEFKPNCYKFPPDWLYFSYGLFGSIMLYYITNKYSLLIKKVDKYDVIVFVSSNSFYLYLIHIFVLYTYNFIIDSVLKVQVFNYYLLKFFVVISLSFIILFLVSKFIINKSQKRNKLFN